MSQLNGTDTLVTKAKLERALNLNLQMEHQLQTAKEKIDKLVKNVREIYSANETRIRNYLNITRKKGVGIRGAYLRGGTFYLKGNMFFKDFDCRNCPDNPDYKQRKANNEMFPMDLDLKGRHVWSLKDKKGVVDGIKEQIIVCLNNSGKDAGSLNTKEHDSEKLIKLLEMVGSDFHIDWSIISQHNLQHRHTAKSCECIWDVFLQPSLTRGPWTDEENEKLLEAAQQHKCQDWKAIAEQVGGRSDFMCFVQYQNYVCYWSNEKSNKWVKEDDARLIEVIERNKINGIINWSNVMVHFPQKARTTLQCRYSYSLSPHIDHTAFTPEEDLLLLASVKEYGTKFSSFPRSLFPNRTTVQLRSRYRNTLVHRHKPKTWTLEDDTKLVEFVKEHGTKSWKSCEEVIHSHSRISCRTRFMVISNFLKKNPDATLVDLPRKKQAVWNYVNTQNWAEKLTELRENPHAQLVKKVRRAPVRRKEYKKKTERKRKEKVVKTTKKEEAADPKEEKIVRAPRRKSIYVERLRPNSVFLYHSFKYAYDVQVGKDPFCSLNASKLKSLSYAKVALAFPQHSDIRSLRFDSNIPTHLRPRISKTLRKDTANVPNGYLFPPSWPTLVGFRALCINASREDIQTENKPNENDSNEELLLFRKRFRTLFYSTALISRLHPSLVGLGHSSKLRLNGKRSLSLADKVNKSEHVQKKAKVIDISEIDQVLNIRKEKTAMN